MEKESMIREVSSDAAHCGWPSIFALPSELLAKQFTSLAYEIRLRMRQAKWTEVS
ncbi:hypothetical protein N9006_01125 [bacterium]|nr:hypothetical protein [Mariniblastus sp.]MDA7924608.1 hypothetical protein [Mariniblastus sp.]MDB4391931.1 hypothetical protein [bacterium]MDB4396549.1 hypothetical protein [bacterium]